MLVSSLNLVSLLDANLPLINVISSQPCKTGDLLSFFPILYPYLVSFNLYERGVKAKHNRRRDSQSPWNIPLLMPTFS